MPPIRFFQVALGVSFATLILSVVAGNVIQARWPALLPAARSILGAVLVLSLVVFIYSMVPVAINGFVRAQIRLGNESHSLVRFLREEPWKAWIAVWVIWTVGLLIGLPFLIRAGNE